MTYNITIFSSFFGWLTVINSGILLISTLLLLWQQDRCTLIHAKLFKLDSHFLNQTYFQFLAYYKLAIIIFNLTPYLTLKLIS